MTTDLGVTAQVFAVNESQITKFYRDADGNYLGGYAGAEPPNGAIAVASPPNHAKDKWVNGAWVPAVIVPQRVEMRQARLALLKAGLLSKMDAAIDSIPSPQKEAARIEWEYAQYVNRDKALVATLGRALRLTDAEIDQLFITAESL